MVILFGMSADAIAHPELSGCCTVCIAAHTAAVVTPFRESAKDSRCFATGDAILFRSF